MKKHLIVVACALVLIGPCRRPAGRRRGRKGASGPAFEGSAHVNLATDFVPAIEIQALTNGEDADTAPITGADRGYFLVSTVPAGAEIYLEGLGGTRYHQGNTSAGPLNVTICLTCTPVRKLVANLSGYADAVFTIAAYPPKDGTVPVLLTLQPIATPTPTPGPFRPNAIPGRIEAENYDLGGEGVAYHDTTPGNAGGLYRTDDVDLERFPAEGTPSVGWIRSSEWLTYTATVAQSGTYTLRARVASPYPGRKAYLSVDGAPKATIEVPYTGSFATFATVQVPVTLTAGTRVLKVYFSGDGQNLNWLDFASGTVTTLPPGTTSFTAAPLSAPMGTAVKFTLTPKAGRTVKSVWWSFDAPAHLNTWNSRAVSPTFFYPRTGTFSPLVRITYTDNSVEEVRRASYVRVT